MKREILCFNVIFLLFAGCANFGGGGSDKIGLALYVEQEPYPGGNVEKFQVFIHDPSKTKTMVFVHEFGKQTLEGASLRDDDNKDLWITLHFNSGGSLLLENITSQYQSQQIFFVVAIPDTNDKKKVVRRCIGTLYVHNALRTSTVNFLANAEVEEAMSIVKKLNKAIGKSTKVEVGLGNANR